MIGPRTFKKKRPRPKHLRVREPSTRVVRRTEDGHKGAPRSVTTREPDADNRSCCHRSLRESAREAVYREKQYPFRLDVAYASSEHFDDAGHLLLAVTHRKFVARLSLGGYKRGLSLLNVICHQGALRGYSTKQPSRARKRP